MCVCVCVYFTFDHVCMWISPLTPSSRDPRCSRWMNPLVAMAAQPALGERQAAREEVEEE